MRTLQWKNVNFAWVKVKLSEFATTIKRETSGKLRSSGNSSSHVWYICFVISLMYVFLKMYSKRLSTSLAFWRYSFSSYFFYMYDISPMPYDVFQFSEVEEGPRLKQSCQYHQQNRTKMSSANTFDQNILLKRTMCSKADFFEECGEESVRVLNYFTATSSLQICLSLHAPWHIWINFTSRFWGN